MSFYKFSHNLINNSMKLIYVLTSLVVLSSCVKSAGGPAAFVNTKEAVAAYNNVKVTKRGKACTKNILTLFSFGDSSIEEAKRNGNIKNVASIDNEFFNILGFYQKACVVVRGN